MEIKDYRGIIDAIDILLLELINHRCKCALQIDALKKASNAEVYDPVREKEILANLLQRNSGPLTASAVAEVFALIMSACRRLQERSRE